MTAPQPFTPKQCLPKTSHLLGAMIGESTITVARKFLTDILPPIPAGSTIHDNGCGTGAVTRAILEAYPHLFTTSQTEKQVKVLATDLNPTFIADLPSHFSAFPSPLYPSPGNGIETLVQDTHSLSQITSGSITHSFTNFLIFGVKDPVLAAQEVYRTLAPGGVAVFTTWATLPHSPALDRTRAQLYDEWTVTTLPDGSEKKMPVQHVDEKWFNPHTTVDILRKAGFENDKIQAERVQSGMEHESLDAWTQMGWSWMGMPKTGWTEREEREWDADRALFGRECLGQGFEVGDDGRGLRVKMEANVVLGWK